MSIPNSLHGEGVDANINASGYLDLKGNTRCNDCGIKRPDWVSVPFGVLVCLKCSGRHRSFGAHITSVRSLKLDRWGDTEESANDIHKLVSSGGNGAFKSYITSLKSITGLDTTAQEDGMKYPVEANAGTTENNEEYVASVVKKIYGSLELEYYKHIVNARSVGETGASHSLEQYRTEQHLLNETATKNMESNIGTNETAEVDRYRFSSDAAQRAFGTVAPTIDGAHWIPDRIVNKCMLCSASFNLFNRKHHCRQCGRCCCEDCAPYKNTKPVMELGITDAVRHCKACYRSPMVRWSD